MKKLKNTTGSNIIVKGQTIAPSAYYTLSQHEELSWRDETEITDKITSGDLLFNDGTSDITDKPLAVSLLNAADADSIVNKLVNGQPSSNGHLPLYNLTSDKLDWGFPLSGVGTLIPYQFWTSGNVSDKWLNAGGANSPSDNLPLIIPQASSIKGITYSNRDDDTDTDLELYVNNVLVYTEQIRNKRVAWIVGGLSINIDQGDRLSVFLKKYTGGTGDNTPQDPLVTVLGKFVTEVAADDGIQTGLGDD